MKKNKFIIWLSIILIFIYVLNLNPIVHGEINKIKNKFYRKTLNDKFKVKIKSGNLSTDYDINQALKDINKLGLNTVNIPVVINIKNLSSNDMSVDKESEKKAIELIKRLRWKKINIILEPYPWIDNGNLYETEWNPNNKKQFFENWQNNVLKVLIDNIAVPYHVDALNVASNFVYIENEEEYWCNTIDFVRKYYKGLVTYRTCWWYTAHWEPKTKEKYQEKLNNKLFSKVDFISVAAYFELTDKDTNTVEELVKAIDNVKKNDRRQNIKEELYHFNEKWHKPIFFGELGFPRKSKAASEPWNPIPSNNSNNEEQARCFEAYRKVFEKEPWLLGFSIFAIGDNSFDKNYYPSEESIKVIKKWYSK
ncbi:hydrolase [Clostridium botulinum A2 117]|uniref:Hydrolase n=1 Tax=Clostridium botulinum TaxID=1491 RepID=A0AA44BQD7_CLOBO|nr:hydrolase [Clostridium botulinum]KEI78280.1 hydrolase [Clostridium botulinum A2 117]MBN3415483.1 hydrolase [Clostridium botulinum]MBN3441776.1 hydrolase [Clostridium botulinum]MBY6805827.1 hydrolase [Clostridium botulinum]NFI07028.1 hydrolase [Clostridium botulinum]